MRAAPFLFASLLGWSLVASAAPKPKSLRYEPEVKLAVEELLSLPAENRVAVALKRGSEFNQQLEKIAFTKEEDYRLRWKALTLLAQLQGVRSEPILNRGLAAPEWYMRNASLLAYAEVLPKKSKKAAEKLLKDRALIVRAAAVQVLAKSMDESVRETLWSEIGNSKNFRKRQSLFIRSQILNELAKTPLDREAPLFVKHLNENDRRLHIPAIAALEKITSRKLGKANDNLQKKRQLWIQWAKNTPELR